MSVLTRLVGVVCAEAVVVATLTEPASAAIPTPDNRFAGKTAPSNC